MTETYLIVKCQAGIYRFSKENLAFQPRLIQDARDQLPTDGLEFLKFTSKDEFLLLDECKIQHFRVQDGNSANYTVKSSPTSFEAEDLCCFDCTGEYAATGSWNGEVRLWKLRGDYETQILISHTEVVHDVKFCKELLVTAGGDAKLCIHGNLSDDEAKILCTINFSSDIMKISVSETYLAAASDNEVRVYKWEKIARNVLDAEGTISSSNGSIMGSIRAIEFSQAGRLIVASSQRRVTIWSCVRNRKLGVIHHNPVLVG